ncbi:hypothetical protein DFJ74DRAFT_705014 [Hyaloraphidium curvatum]|nr:hypothetical protein DFJ74DRAFT_705014 [Hyaloraphidium curvatum]
MLRIRLPVFFYKHDPDHLEYIGINWPEFFLAINEGCPRLETVPCGIDDLPEDCHGLMPDRFVAKIET